MEVGEKDLARLEQGVFGGQRLLDLHDQVGLLECRRVVADHRRARLDITLVGIARAGASVALDHHLVPLLAPSAGGRGGPGRASLLRPPPAAPLLRSVGTRRTLPCSPVRPAWPTLVPGWHAGRAECRDR